MGVQPNDIITLDERLWIVSGVFLGALGEESLMGLRSHSHGDGSAYGKRVEEMMVPVVMVENLIDHGIAKHHPDRSRTPNPQQEGR